MSTTEVVEPESSLSDEMAADVKPVKKPRGAPALWPFLQLPRRKRAEFLRGVAAVQSRQEQIEKAAEAVKAAAGQADANEGVGIAQAADLYDILADIEELLLVVASDAEAFTKWANAASDDALSDLLFWYMERFQVGEARASST